jgi:predicted PurR-regulated permease PerM
MGEGILRRVSDIAWRLLVIGLAVVAFAYLLGKLRIVVLAVYFALLLTAVVVPVVRRLEERGWPTLAATWTGFGGFLLLVLGTIGLMVPFVVEEFRDFPAVLEEGIDDVEDWLVDGPVGMEREKIDEYRDNLGENIGDLLQSSSDGIVAGAIAFFEGLLGSILALVLSFFLIKDGRRFQRWFLDHLPDRHQELTCSLAGGAWNALGGYLRGAALLGIVEAIVIGGALWAVGATLVLPVMVLTFIGAFVPLVGAVVAGILAVLVALVSGGFGDALVIGIVAVLVQQLDNDLLAPFIYGKTVSLHPAVILVAIASGSALAGLAGAFLSVPVAAVATAMASDLWNRHGEEWRSSA